MGRTSNSEAVAPASRLASVRIAAARWGFEALRRYTIAVSLVIIIVILSFASEHFLTLSNLTNILLQSANTGIMAVGMTLVIITGEIDLSVASVQSLAAVIVALLMVNVGLGIVPSVIIALMVGTCAGAISGFFTGRFLIPAFIVTLGVDSAARGTALLVTKGESIYGLPGDFSVLGQGYLGPFPVAAMIAAVTFLAAHILLTRTAFGVNVYAVGGNREAARIAGINVGLVKGTVLALSGFTAALAGVIIASRLSSAQAIIGLFDLMDVIAAVVIGGTSLMGGQGTVLGTVIGTLIIAIIRNGLNLLGIPADLQLIAIGIIIVFAVLTDYVWRGR